MKCTNCSAPNVVYNAATKMYKCEYCDSTYLREELFSNGKVSFAKDNAVRYFKDANMSETRHYAREVIDYCPDHMPANYMISFCDEFASKRPESLKNFFGQLEEANLLEDELDDLFELFILNARALFDYEYTILSAIIKNEMTDARVVTEFLDSFCPYLIKRRPSISYLTEDQVKAYSVLASRYGIPKTCYALLTSIKENPDSPYVNDEFDLPNKTSHYLANYVEPIGSIIKEMNGEHSDKFLETYELILQEYKGKIK